MVDRLTNTPGSRPTTPTQPHAGEAPRAPTSTPSPNDRLLFVAMNNSDAHRSTLEADALRNRGVNVTLIQDARVDDTVKVGTSTFDLTKPEGTLAFVQTLRLPAEQSQKIAKVIDNAEPDARDELAQLAQVWATAERNGTPGPARLILSGHHVGGGVYGENNGRLDWPTVGALTAAMPNAARGVEDLMIAGCYSGGESMMEKYTAMFPNLKTAVAYSGSSPGASSGATVHQKIWEQKTRGASEGITRAMFDGTRKGENVTVWTRTHGFDDGRERANLDELKSNRALLQSAYTDAYSGATPITDPQSCPLRNYYNSLQRLIQHPNLSPTERRSLEAERDQTIRLLFYAPVSAKFQDVYGAKVSAAYYALNLTPPNFKTLSRSAALAAIHQFDEALARSPNPPPQAVQMKSVLADFSALKSNIVLETWV